jgi:GMP synthase (glutamine-hydrolysing)
VYEQDRHPWIGCQLRRLARRVDAGLPTLGVCFGAQMMAAAMGARVYAGPTKEVGFHPLRFVDRASPLGHLSEVPVLHWHGDTFDLPDDVELLGSTDAYRHQAFRRGRNILALQFHAEMGLDPRFDEWIRQWPEAPVEAGSSAAALDRDHREHGPGAVVAGRRMIAQWLSELTG